MPSLRLLAIFIVPFILSGCRESADSAPGIIDDSGTGNASAETASVVPAVTTAKGVDPRMFELPEFKCLLVNTSVEQISDALSTDGWLVKSNVDSSDFSEPTADLHYMYVLQFKGQTWAEVSNWGRAGLADAPRYLSRLLNCRTLEFGYNDTSACFYHYLHESGEIVESFVCTDALPFDPESEHADYWEPPEFKSRIREVDFTRQEHTAVEFTSDFVRSLGAYAIFHFPTSKDNQPGPRGDSDRSEIGWWYEAKFPHKDVKRLAFVYK